MIDMSELKKSYNIIIAVIRNIKSIYRNYENNLKTNNGRDGGAMFGQGICF